MGRYDKQIEQEKKQIRNKERILHQKYPGYRKMIEQYMLEEKYDRIEALFQEKDVLEIAQMDTEFAILNIIVNINRMEQKEKEEYKIWNQMHSIEEILNIFLTVKMFMWRIEFTEDQTHFIDYVLEHKISVSYIKWLIHTSAFKKADTAFKIAMLYKERKYYVQTFAMLNYFNELSDEKELIYCEMADVWMQMQQYQAAEDCMKKIQNHSVLLEQYKRKWGLVDEGK